MRNFIFLMLVLFGVSAHAQIVVDKEYGPYQPIEYTLSPTSEADSKAIWEIVPLSNQNEYASRQYGQVFAFWGQPGKYRLIATEVIVDFELKTFDIKKHQAEFLIKGDVVPPVPPVPPEPNPPGPNPPEPNPPAPDPDLPGDKFDDLAIRIDTLADEIGLQYDKRLAVAEIFSSVVEKMKAPNDIMSITSARAYVMSKLSAMNLPNEWDSVKKLVVDDGEARAPLSWVDAMEWYEAVSTGYKGEE